jgi:hypothetical protein
MAILDANTLKKRIKYGELSVDNLKLTKDNRLIDANDNCVEYTKIVDSMIQEFTNKLHITYDSTKVIKNMDVTTIRLNNTVSQSLKDYSAITFFAHRNNPYTPYKFGKIDIKQGNTESLIDSSIHIALGHMDDPHLDDLDMTVNMYTLNVNHKELTTAAKFLCAYTINHLSKTQRGKGYNYKALYDASSSYTEYKKTHKA